MRVHANLLKKLYESKNKRARKSILSKTSPEDIRCVLETIKACLSGKIPLKDRDHWQQIVKSKKLHIISKLKHEGEIEKITKQSKVKQREYLASIPCYRQLFHACFNLKA